MVLRGDLQRDPENDTRGRHRTRRGAGDRCLCGEDTRCRRACTEVNESVFPAAVGLLGCGVLARIGAAINTGDVSRGISVAVIGCVGFAAIAGFALAGAAKIIAVDVEDSKP